MTDEQLKEIRARLATITPGEWTVADLLAAYKLLESEQQAIRKIIGVQSVERNGVQLTLPEIVQDEYNEWRKSIDEYMTAIADLRDSPGFRYEPDELGAIVGSAMEVLHVAKREMARYAAELAARDARIAELEGAIKGLVEDAHPIELQWGWDCWVCGHQTPQEVRFQHAGIESIQHAPDCAWQQAQRLIGSE